MNEFIKKYKNIHLGKRVFIIGNGPSLAKTNLDLIKNEFSIAMNGINKIYSKTNWRPSYYVFTSNLIEKNEFKKDFTNNINQILEYNTTAFIWKRFQTIIGNKKNIEWIINLTEKKNSNMNIEKSWWPDNIEERLDKSGTTMNVAFQIANYMGFNEIILLGADLGYKKPKSNLDVNHFCNDYIKILPKNDYQHFLGNIKLRNLHIMFRNKIPKNIKIYNASLKSILDIYPLIDFTKYIEDDIIQYRNEELEKNKILWSRITL